MQNSDRLVHGHRIDVDANGAWLLLFQNGKERLSHLAQTNH